MKYISSTHPVEKKTLNSFTIKILTEKTEYKNAQ